MPTLTDKDGVFAAGYCTDYEYELRLETPVDTVGTADDDAAAYRVRIVDFLSHNGTHIELDAPPNADF